MKPTDNEPQRPAAPTSAVDPAKKKKQKKNKRVANVVVVIMGVLLYVDLFAQPGCDDSTGGTGAAIDASSIDGASIDAPIDSPVVVPPDDSGPADAPATALDPCWSDVVGKWNSETTQGCGIGGGLGTTLSLGVGTINLTPFSGSNPNGVNFTPSAMFPKEAIATNVTTQGITGRECKVTCLPGATPAQSSIYIICKKPDAQTCNETMFKAN